MNNMSTKYTRGWIRMQVLSGMVEVGKFVPGIANSDTELDKETVLLLMEYFSNCNCFGKTVKWNRSQPRRNIKVSTVVGYLDEVLNGNGIATP